MVPDERTPTDAGANLPIKLGRLQKLFKDQRFLYIVVGAGNTLFCLLLFAALVFLFGQRIPATINLLITWVIALVCIFFVHRTLVFRVRGYFWRDLARFAGVNGLLLLVNLSLILLLVDFMKLPPVPVQFGITCIFVVFSYASHKHFSFSRKEIDSEEGEIR